MVTGLVAVGAIFAVQGVGYETKDIFCHAAKSIEEGLEKDVSRYHCKTSTSAENTEGQTPKIPEGTLDGNFINIVFPKGTTEKEYINIPLNEQHTAGGSFSVSPNQTVLACFQETQSSEPTCTANLNSTQILNFPGTAYSVGYTKFFSEDTREQDNISVSLILKSNDANIPTQSWPIDISREADDILLNPSFNFADVIVPRNVQTYQVMETMTGDFNGNMILSATDDTSRDTKTCHQPTQTSPITCTSGNITIPKTTYAVGYQLMGISTDPVTAYKRDVSILLRSSIDANVKAYWSIDATRESEPVILNLTTDFENPKIIAPESLGLYTVLQPFIVESNAPMSLRGYGTTGIDVQSCIQSMAGGSISCSSSSTLLPHDTYAIGYRIQDLPEDNRNAYSKNFKLGIYSGPSPMPLHSWNLSATKEGAPIKFTPTMTFEDVTLPQGQVEDVIVLKNLEGDFNGNMTFQARPASFEYDLMSCIQETSTSNPVCSDNTKIITKDTYAFGYKVTNIPTDTLKSYTKKIYLNLASQVNASTNRIEWTPTLTRTPVALEFTPTTVFDDETIAKKTVTDFQVMKNLTGSFNGDMLYYVSGPPSKFEICVQNTSFSTVDCTNSTGKTITKDTYAIGYKIKDLPADDRKDYTATFSLNLMSKVDTTKKETWPITVTRTPVPIEFNSTTVFDNEVIAHSTTTHTPVMQRFTGDFNGPMIYSAGSSNVSACIQHLENGDITCASTAKTIQPGAYAIGYQVTGLSSDPFIAYSNNITLRLYSSMDTTNYQKTWPINVTRTKKPVTLSPTTTFANNTIPQNWTTAYEVTELLTGDMNGRMGFSVTGTGIQICFKATSATAAFTCQTGSKTIAADTYAIGYKMTDIPANTSTAYSKTFTLKLTSYEDATTPAKTWTVTNTRTPS
jgi:hypothetical protein